tara:strand:+ start:1240 stop:3114 length:1875 start_codon:yes stop_codon:yes gene_type:complete
MANRISAIIDVQADKAQSLKKFRTELKNTEGGFNKLKKVGGASFDAIKQNAGAMAMGAGTALIGFAAKSVMAFNETAIAAGNFADSTGLAVEDASRWMSVADDMGLNADTMQKAFLKLNKEIATGSAVQKQYGIDSVLAADGQVDVNATMLQAIDTIGKMKDPTERAMVAQQMFGRSYAEIAEIVLGDAEKIRAGLESTSDAQVIDEDEVRKAREMRRAMDELNDVLSDVTLSIGEHLTPAITNAVDDMKTLARAIGSVGDAAESIPLIGDHLGTVIDVAKKVVSPIEMARSVLDGFTDDTVSLADAVIDAAGGMGTMADATEASITAAEDAAEAAKALSAAVEENAKKYYEAVEATEALTAAQVAAVPEAFSLEKAQLNLSLAVDDYRQKVIDTTAVLDDSESTDAEKVAALQSLRVEQIGLAEELFATTVEYAKQQGATEGSTAAAQFQLAELLRLKAVYPELGNEIDTYIDGLSEIPDVVSTDIEALIDEGQLSTAEALLNNVARNRTATITIAANNRSATVGLTPGNMPATDFSGVDFGSAFFGATGGLVTRPTKAVIGESGPELVLPVNKGALDGAPGASPLSSMLGGLSPTDAAAITAAVEQGMIRGFRGIRQNERAS